MRVGQKWAERVLMFVCVAIILSSIAIAWQQSPPQPNHDAIVAAMKLRAMQSVPAIPFPSVSVPMTDAEYNAVQNYCIKIVVWLKKQQSFAFDEAQKCRDRISTPRMATYYSTRMEWWQEIMDEIDFMDQSTHLIDAEVEDDLEGLAMKMTTAKGHLQAGNVTQAKAVMATAFDKAKNIVTLGPNGFNLDMLNATYDSLGQLWDDISENERDAAIEEWGVELGAHI